jgi:hypothetical protein
MAESQNAGTTPQGTTPAATMTPAESLAAAKAAALKAPSPSPASPAAASPTPTTAATAEGGATSSETSAPSDGTATTASDATAETPADEPDAQVMKRSAAIAERERRLRETRKQQQEQLQAGEQLGKARAAFKAGNDMEGLQLLGLDVDEVYGRLTRAILAQGETKEPPSTEELVDRKVDEKLKEKAAADQKVNQERLQAEEARLRGVYLDKTYAVLDAQADKFPDVVRALGTRKVTEQDICETAEAYWEARKQPPTPEVVLGLIQEQLSSKKKPAAQSTPAAEPVVPASSSWTNNAPPSTQQRPMTREESLREAKRAAGLTV